ncbi:MAG TPA: DMT family transporter [Propionibacterium sp.]|nr:DMT family transporter [Propionibacterium sp.]
MSQATRSYLLLLLCSIIWGFAFVAQREGAQHLGAFSFNAARGVLGVAALMPLIWFLDRRAGLDGRAGRAAWRGALGPGVFIGLMFFGGQTMQQLGIEQTTAGNAAFVTGLYMVLVPVAGRLLGLPTSLMNWLGIGLAVPGLFLLTWTDAGIGAGDLIVLVGTLFWTFHILGVGRFARRVDPIRLSVVQFVVMTVLSTGTALAVEPEPFGGVIAAGGALLYAGILSTGVGFTLQIVGQRHARASIAAMILSLEALWGAVGGALLLGERLTLAGLVGAALMMAGILLAQVPTRADRRREAALAEAEAEAG